MVSAVTRRGCLPVASLCSSIFDEISAVVNSVSAAVPAPPTPVPATAPRPLGVAALEVPLRLVVRLAEEAVPLACLLPLQPGLIIPINACPEMPVHLGDHLVGWASLTPLPDGRQQANIITIDLKPAGERA
jgi:hypothetical protein